MRRTNVANRLAGISTNLKVSYGEVSGFLSVAALRRSIDVLPVRAAQVLTVEFFEIPAAKCSKTLHSRRDRRVVLAAGGPIRLSFGNLTLRKRCRRAIFLYRRSDGEPCVRLQVGRSSAWDRPLSTQCRSISASAKQADSGPSIVALDLNRSSCSAAQEHLGCSGLLISARLAASLAEPHRGRVP